MITVFLLIMLSVIYLFFKPGTITGFITRTGQLQIGNAAPIVDYIYLNDMNCTDNPNDVIINPVANSTISIIVKSQIEDLNGNCNEFTNNNGTAYLCSGTGSCNENTANHTITMNYDSGDGQWGDGNKYCNMTGSAESLWFFEINGSWKVNVTITDGIDYDNLEKTWKYNELRSFTYPPSGSTINMGNLNLEQWNNGTAGDLMLNAGNIVLDLLWNATNFTGQTYDQEIDINGTNYVIDDDNSGTDDTGNIPEVYINETPENRVYFDPESGLLRCTDQGCGNENATFNVYWHIYIPSGLSPDTYINSIEIASEDHPGQ